MFWFSLGTMTSNWEHPSNDYLTKLASVHCSVGADSPFAQLFSCFGRRLNPAAEPESRSAQDSGGPLSQAAERPPAICKICPTLNPAQGESDAVLSARFLTQPGLTLVTWGLWWPAPP